MVLQNKFSKLLSSKGLSFAPKVSNELMMNQEYVSESKRNSGCMNYDFTEMKILSGGPTNVSNREQQVYDFPGVLTAKGEKLSEWGVIFKTWRKVLFVFDFSEQEIRYYDVSERQDQFDEVEPAGIIKFDQNKEKEKLEIKSVRSAYKGRKDVIVLKGGKGGQEGSTKGNQKIVMSFDSQLNMLDWKHRILALTKQTLKNDNNERKRYFLF